MPKKVTLLCMDSQLREDLASALDDADPESAGVIRGIPDCGDGRAIGLAAKGKSGPRSEYQQFVAEFMRNRPEGMDVSTAMREAAAAWRARKQG